MASPEAKIRMRTEAIRGLEYVAERAGNEEQVREFTDHINQPTYGDAELRDIFTLQGALNLLASAAGVDLEEVDLSDEARIYEYRESDNKMHESGSDDQAGTEGPENPLAQLPSENPDELQEPSDQDVEDSYGESDILLADVNPEEGVADELEQEYELADDEEAPEESPEGSEEEAEESEAERKRRK